MATGSTSDSAKSEAAKGGPFASRMTSIDAYRGLVMLLMMAEVLRLRRVADALPDSRLWAFLAEQQTHVLWVGCVLHDLIQPSFSFLVGVTLPLSLARRCGLGQPLWQRTLHAFWRALVLVLLGVFLRSLGREQTYWTFEDTLTQIGLGYGFLYLLALTSRRVQWSFFGLIVIGYWLLFALYPLPESFPPADPGTALAASNELSGFAAHWNLDHNPAMDFDRWFLNLFPREQPFTGHSGGYVTLSFIPTLATMLLGLLAGGVLTGTRESRHKICWLLVAGAVGLALGWGCQLLGICPVVKRIWTPSWVLYSGGWCFLILAAFYTVIDVWKQRAWAFPLVVVGMNSIAAYMIAHLFEHFIESALVRHVGETFFLVAGEPYRPLLLGAAVLLVEWLILYWMYVRRIFLRI